MQVNIMIRTLSGRTYNATGKDFAQGGDGTNHSVIESNLRHQIESGKAISYSSAGGRVLIPAQSIESVAFTKVE